MPGRRNRRSRVFVNLSFACFSRARDFSITHGKEEPRCLFTGHQYLLFVDQARLEWLVLCEDNLEQGCRIWRSLRKRSQDSINFTRRYKITAENPGRVHISDTTLLCAIRFSQLTACA